MKKQYLGDGVYIEIDYDTSLVLTTENGIEVTNRIVLERETLCAMIKYIDGITGRS
jgi:hypothetical protein